MAEKPPIRVVENPFGDFTDEQLAGDPSLKDRFYLAGYSDKRHERELAAKAHEKPETLQRRFQYVSVENSAGQPNKAKYVEWIARGYRAVKYDELKSLGIDPENSTCERGADGNARVGSQILMMCDAPTAAHHFRRNQELIDSQFAVNVREPLEKSAADFNRKHGYTETTGAKFEIVESVEDDD